jgi:hypothetical protein
MYLTDNVGESVSERPQMKLQLIKTKMMYYHHTSCHGSITQSRVDFKSKIITIQIKTHQAKYWNQTHSDRFFPDSETKIKKGAEILSMLNFTEALQSFLIDNSFKILITGVECQPGIKRWPLSQRQLTTQLVSGQLNLQTWIPAF